MSEGIGGVGSTSVPWATECGCLACQDERRKALAPEDAGLGLPGMDRHFRFACETCGNKRCPHHTDHRLECSGSNATGQPGSVYQ